MPSLSETALLQMLALLQTTGATVERNTPLDLTMQIPANGLVILRDGEPGEPEVMLGQLDYQYDHTVEVELFAQGPADTLDATFDALRLNVGQVLAANRTLGGSVMWIEPRPSRAVDLPQTSELPIKAASLSVVMTYVTPTPIN